jgi:hypothetical protein
MVQGKHFNMEEEFAGLDFHSVRLEERFVRTMKTLIQQPDASIREATIRRMVEYGGTILAMQDTTGVNYNTHEKTGG